MGGDTGVRKVTNQKQGRQKWEIGNGTSLSCQSTIGYCQRSRDGKEGRANQKGGGEMEG
jgi:hypothetical protein